MDVRYINPFLSAIRNVFEKMLGLPFQLGKPQLKQDSFPLYDVSAFIGLSGTASGCVVLCLAKPMALTSPPLSARRYSPKSTPTSRTPWAKLQT